MLELEKYYDPHRDKRPVAPIEEQTGVPLPIAPHTGSKIEMTATNAHHAIYPKNHPVLLHTLGGRALRSARLQIVPASYHNQDSPTAFHNVYGNGIAIPQDANEQMGLCALLVGGYIPDLVVDTSKGQATTRYITDWEKKLLTKTVPLGTVAYANVKSFRDRILPDATLKDAKSELTRLKVRVAGETYTNLHVGENHITAFFRDFIFSQDPSKRNRRLMGSFLLRGEPEEGMTLLGIAARIAAEEATVQGESFQAVFYRLQRAGKLNPNLRDNVATFMLERTGTKFGRKNIVQDFRTALEKRAA